MIDIVNNLLGYLCVVLAIILYPIFCLKELFEKISILRKGMNCFEKKDDKEASFITVSAEENCFPVSVPLNNSIDSGYIANHDWRKNAREEDNTSFWEYMLANDTGYYADED